MRLPWEFRSIVEVSETFGREDRITWYVNLGLPLAEAEQLTDAPEAQLAADRWLEQLERHGYPPEHE